VKSKNRKKQSIKITPSTIAGLLMGTLMIAAGIYTVVTYGGYSGYYFAGLGIFCIVLIFVILLTRR